jgi:hypothetical protein
LLHQSDEIDTRLFTKDEKMMSLMTVMRRRTTQKDGVIYRPLKTCIEASRFAIYPRFSFLEG